MTRSVMWHGATISVYWKIWWLAVQTIANLRFGRRAVTLAREKLLNGS